MKKAIILISGNPAGKNKFIEVSKKVAWSWNVNLHSFLGSKANGFYWDGEQSGEYFNFTFDFFSLVHKYFQLDDSETKQNSKSVFDKFVLIVHGVSKELDERLKDEYGVYRIHISKRDNKDNIELYDLVLYEDDDNFESEVSRVINVLAK